MSTFRFEEQEDQVYYHRLKVFIMGVDVSPYLVGSLSVNRVGRSGISSCSFVLSNAYRCFEMTNDNLYGSKKFTNLSPYGPEGKYSEKAKAEIFRRKRVLNVRHSVKTFGPVKGANAGAKILGSVNRSSTTSDSTDRYPFNVGSLVFHKYDEVAVFIANPLKDTENEWVQIFSGYIDTKPFSQDYVTGQSLIRVSCQDIRVKIASMRTQLNPFARVGNENALVANPKVGPGGAAGVTDRIDAGFFNDLIGPTRTFSHVLAAYTWLDSVKFLIFGTKSDPQNINTKVDSYGRIGGTRMGETYTYSAGMKNRESFLASWNNLVLFGTKKTFLTKREMEAVGRGTYPGGNHSSDNKHVHFLLPATGMPQHNLIEFNKDGNINTRVDWSSRLELITSLCKNIDYEFYIAGNGDFIFEFPQYDFLPSSYGATYNRLYTVSKHVVNDTVDDEGGEPVSAVEVTSAGSLFAPINENHPEAADTGQNAGAPAISAELRRIAFSNVMASRFGVNIKSLSFPGVTDQGRLGQLALLEFNKSLAEFNRLSLSIAYRPFMLLNRALYYTTKERIALIESVSYNWEIRGNVTCELNLNYVRKLEGNGKFRFVTGGEGVPISYNAIFSDPSSQRMFLEGQGVNVGPTPSNTPPKPSLPK